MKETLERALEIRERVLGLEHADTAVTLTDLGVYVVWCVEYLQQQYL